MGSGAGRTVTRQRRATGADVSERLTWKTCPRCGKRAAVGWTNNEVVEADCYSECELTEEDLAELQRGDRPPAGEPMLTAGGAGQRYCRLPWRGTPAHPSCARR
jgi:hypothetical protein